MQKGTTGVTLTNTTMGEAEIKQLLAADDPFSGKPFEYHRAGNTFVLSSVWLKEKAETQKKFQ